MSDTAPPFATPEPPPGPVRTCPQCGATSVTRFCGECGYRFTDGAELAADMRAVVREGAADVLGIDRRIVATVRDLLVRPVAMLRAHLSGNAAQYIHPLKLYFVLVGLFVVLLGWLIPFDFGSVASDAQISLPKLVWGTEDADAVRRLFAERGLTEEAAANRFKERSNAATPITSVLALFPLAMLLGALNRGRAMRDHFTFLLVITNAAWLVSLIGIALLAVIPETVALALWFVATYAYLGLGYFGIYGERSRARTTAKFLVLLVADYVIKSAVSLLLSVGILASLFVP